MAVAAGVAAVGVAFADEKGKNKMKEITLEALRERNIKSIVLWKEHAVPTDYKETDKEIFITIASSLVGVRQGDVIITPAGEKIQVTPELMANCYEEFLKS